MNFINQVLMNIVSQGRWTAIAIVVLAALGLCVLVYVKSKGSLTPVLIVVAGAIVAVIVIVQLPDLLKGAASDAPSFTGVNSRY
ncbi:hypothetical protein [Mycobacterium avium]|uniref:hypothetical protein n=1 Tax=Mycobacterium avium TaxID=1764 RepID=UPI000A04EB0F|nr:hypothetical protein [Mycobacterium avium]